MNRVVNFLQKRPDVDSEKISAVAFDELGPTLLHAAAFNKTINSVTLIGPLSSYQAVIMNKFYDTGLTNCFVAGALTAYDLPDLAVVLAPGKLNLINMRDGESKFIDMDKENSGIELIKTAWQQKNAGRQLSIVKENSADKMFEQFLRHIE